MIGQFESFSINRIVAYYRRRLRRANDYLRNNPNEWGLFQQKFNAEMDHLFSQIITFEKRCLKEGREAELAQVKKLFVKRLRKYFYYGDLPRWAIDRPYGYSGDFKIIDEIYKNEPQTMGYERLFDNYFLLSTISVAVRNRKEDIKRKIIKYINVQPHGKKIRVLSLASGPAREVKEMIDANPEWHKNVVFDCFDMQNDAHKYAKGMMNGHDNVFFETINVLKISLARDVVSRVGRKYDLIYSTGLFDYLEYQVSVRLVSNLRKLLKPGGVLLIADVRERYYNPAVFNMEWACNWELVYRTDSEFRNIFVNAGFKEPSLRHSFEQQGIIQYIEAIN
jgi:SAM-dependent methyltransferase